MSHLAPEGPVYQAGTLSGNPLAMSAGLATLSILNSSPELYKSLESKTRYLSNEMAQILNENGMPHQLNQLGSMMSLHFTDEPVVDFQSASKGNNPLFNTYFHGMLKRGVYLPPSAFESYFLNDALSYDDLARTLTAFREVLKEI